MSQVEQPEVGVHVTRPPNSSEPSRRVRRLLLLWPLAGVVGLIVSNASYPPLDDTLLYWIGAVPCLVMATLISSDVWRQVQSETDVRPFSPRTFWLAIVCLAVPMVLFVNGMLDRSPVEKHRQTIMHTVLDRGSKGNDFYYVECSSWRGRSHEKMMISSRNYLKYRPGDPIIVETHRGALGIPLLVSVHSPE